MIVVTDECIACGQCMEICPAGAFQYKEIVSKEYAQVEVNQDKCIECNTCIGWGDCPGDAIKLKM